MPSPILARADALMRRTRQSEATTGEIPVLTDAFDDEDIPVLLDIEASAAGSPAATTPAAEAASVIAPVEPHASGHAADEALVAELAYRVQQRVMAELPHIIETTLRDFLAEQQDNTAD